MPVIFFVDPQLDEDQRLSDVKDITLSYTFFDVKGANENLTEQQGRELLN